MKRFTHRQLIGKEKGTFSLIFFFWWVKRVLFPHWSKQKGKCGYLLLVWCDRYLMVLVEVRTSRPWHPFFSWLFSFHESFLITDQSKRKCWYWNKNKLISKPANSTINTTWSFPLLYSVNRVTWYLLLARYEVQASRLGHHHQQQQQHTQYNHTSGVWDSGEGRMYADLPYLCGVERLFPTDKILVCRQWDSNRWPVISTMREKRMVGEVFQSQQKLLGLAIIRSTLNCM